MIFLILVLGLLLGVASIVFALQNVAVITVTFFTWQIQGSLSFILLSAIAAGVIICLLISIPEVINSYVEFSVLKKINKKLEDENASYKRIVGDFSKISTTKIVESSNPTITSSTTTLS